MNRKSILNLITEICAAALVLQTTHVSAQDKPKPEVNSRSGPENLRALRKPSNRGASALSGYLTRGRPQELRFGSGRTKSPDRPSPPRETNSTATRKKPDSKEQTNLDTGKSGAKPDETRKRQSDDPREDSTKTPDVSEKKEGSGTKGEVTVKNLIPFFQKGRPPEHGASGLVPFRPPLKQDDLSRRSTP